MTEFILSLIAFVVFGIAFRLYDDRMPEEERMKMLKSNDERRRRWRLLTSALWWWRMIRGKRD